MCSTLLRSADELGRCRIALGDELRGELLQIDRQVPALGAREEAREIARMLAEERGNPGEPRALRFLDALGDQARRDVDAVEHIADVVQHVGGHFGHARLPRGDQQLLVHVLELLFGEAPLGDVLHHRKRAERLAGGADQALGARQRPCARRRRAAR